MDFIKKIGKSIYGPIYYQELLEKPFSYSVKYFALFYFIAAVFLVFGFSVFYFPKIGVTINDVVRVAKESYPQDLVVTIKGGNLSTNMDEPYFVKIPDSMSESNTQSKKIENLLVIDTKSEASADNLSKYNTALFITGSHLVFQKESGEVTVQSLEEMPDMVIDRNFVASSVDKYSPYLKLLYPGFVLALFFFSFLIVVFRLAYLLLVALLIWLIAHIKNAEIGYGKSYQLGLHLMTLPLLISPFSAISFPFDFTLILVVLAFFNIKKKDSVATIAPIAQAQVESDQLSVDKQI